MSDNCIFVVSQKAGWGTSARGNKMAATTLRQDLTNQSSLPSLAEVQPGSALIGRELLLRECCFKAILCHTELVKHPKLLAGSVWHKESWLARKGRKGASVG